MIIAVLSVLGLAFGSFVNALVWRVHHSQLPTPNFQLPKNRLSILHGRSMCVHCGHKLSAKDLIPVLSWFWLRGRCRYCGEPISWQYPAVEVTTAFLFVVSFVFWPGFQGDSLKISDIVDFGLWLAVLTGLIALATYDIRWKLLPNKIVFPLLALVVLNTVLQSFLATNYQLLATSALGALVGGGFFFVIFQMSQGKWIGGGDVKLGILLGLVLGDPLSAAAAIFIASLIGTLVYMPLMVLGRAGRKTQIPFGPFLILATIITLLFAQNLIDLYRSAIII